MKNNSISTCHGCGKSRVCVYTLDDFYCWECAGKMLEIAVEIAEDHEVPLRDYVKSAVKSDISIRPSLKWYAEGLEKRRVENDDDTRQ